MPWFEVAPRVALGMSALPVLIGGWCIDRRSTGSRWLWIWLMLALSLNVGLRVGTGPEGISATVAQLSYPLYCVIGLTALGQVLGNRKVKRGFALAMFVYCAWWLLWAVKGELGQGFASYNAPALYLVLSLAAAVVVTARLAENPTRPGRDLAILTGLGVLVSYAPGAALDPVAAIIYESHRSLTFVLFGLRSLLDALGSLLFALAFLWTTPQRDSSGSLASVP